MPRESCARLVLGLLAASVATAGCGGGGDRGQDAIDDSMEADTDLADDTEAGEPDADGGGDEGEDPGGDPDEPEGDEADSDADADAAIEEEWPTPVEGPGWTVRATADAPLYALETECLEAAGTVAAGTELDAWGMNDSWVRVTWDGMHVARGDVEVIASPPPGEDPPASWSGTVGLEETGVFTLDAGGCAVQVGTALESEAYPAYGLSHDANFHGYWQVSPELDMIAVRVLNVPEWIFPWHRAVLLIKEIPGTGFLVGGGVIVAPGAILTAAHMGVDPDFCYVLAPNAATAWYAGDGVCGSIGSFVAHPEVDLGVVLLTSDETRVPPVRVLERWVEIGEEFYAVNMSTMHMNSMSDAAVDEVDGRNAGIDDPACTNSWPTGSSFTTQSSIVGGGDSGGPAFVGTGLAGTVHGEACRWPWEPYRQVFVHTPFFEEWIEGVVAGG